MNYLVFPPVYFRIEHFETLQLINHICLMLDVDKYKNCRQMFYVAKQKLIFIKNNNKKIF